MTKQEVYNALVAKFDRVQPPNEWQKRNAEILGVSAYLLQVWKAGDVPKTYTLHVKDDATQDEEAFFVSEDPLYEPQPAQLSFTQRVQEDIEARKTAGQIVDAFIDSERIGQTVCEVFVYALSNNDITASKYVVYDVSGTLNFKKLV